MKKILLILFLCPLFSAAQNYTHRFQNDTLYTSYGYKIYPGQILRFGKRPSEFNGYRYIRNISVNGASLENNSVVVRELSGYGFSPTGSAMIYVKAAIVYRDSSKGLVGFNLAFDLAAGSRLPGTASELMVPKEYLISTQQAIAMHKPALEDDTLHTSGGFKIYKGQFLQIGEATGINGRFRYVNILTDIKHSLLENNHILVKEIKNLSFSLLGNGYIDIVGTVVLKNNRSKDVEMHISFDYAIENVPGIPGELVVPDEFRGRIKRKTDTEIDRIEMLYKTAIITKEEYEAAAKKLLMQQEAGQ